MREPNACILGTEGEEIVRLQEQHDAWADAWQAMWRCGLAACSRASDLNDSRNTRGHRNVSAGQPDR